MKEAPAALIHHVHVSLVVNQSRGDPLQLSGERQVQSEVPVVVQFIQFPR